MFGLDMSIIKIGMILAIVSILAGGFYSYSNMKADLAVSEQNNKVLDEVITTQKLTIETQQKAYKIISVLNEELNTVKEQQQQEIRDLNNKFNVKVNGESRDFGAIARARPETISRIINNATKKVQRCFEIASGAPLNDGETNSECKNLIGSSTQ